MIPIVRKQPTRSYSQPWWVLTCWMMLLLPATVFADEALDHFNAAHEWVQQGQHEKAISELRLAIKDYPSFAEAHHLLGLVYFSGLNQPGKAVAALKRAVTHYPNFARAHFDLGIIFQHQKNNTEAEIAYQSALALYPRFQEAQLTLANLYDQTQQPQKAIQAFTHVLELNPDEPDALYKLAFWYRQTGDIKQARILLARLHQTQQNHLRSWLLLGDIAEQEQKPKEAIQAYKQALDIKGDILVPHEALGFLYQEQGESQLAAKHFTEVVKLAPNDADAHLNFGVVLASLQLFDKAEREYQAAIALDPKLTDAYFNLGVFYEFHRKDTEKALVQYREYLKRGGADERIAKLLKKVEK